MMGMSNDEVVAFNRQVIADFRAHDGVMPEGSVFHGNPTLLLTMTGARSGRSLTSPLSYVTDDGDWIVMASAGGSEKTPAWAHNLRAEPNVVIEVPGERVEVHAVETAGGERDHAFTTMTTQLPRFAAYQEQVERLIPLFRLRRRT